MGHALSPWGEKECRFSLCHQKNGECKILLNNLIQIIKISGIVEKTKTKTKQKTKQKPKEWLSKTRLMILGSEEKLLSGSKSMIDDILSLAAACL